MNLEDDRERSQTAAGLWLCRFPRCVCSSADALQQQLRGEAPPLTSWVGTRILIGDGGRRRWWEWWSSQSEDEPTTHCGTQISANADSQVTVIDDGEDRSSDDDATSGRARPALDFHSVFRST